MNDGMTRMELEVEEFITAPITALMAIRTEEWVGIRMESIHSRLRNHHSNNSITTNNTRSHHTAHHTMYIVPVRATGRLEEVVVQGCIWAIADGVMEG